MYSNLPIQNIDSPESDYLYTDPSQIVGAGLGLFTAIKIYKYEVIAVFAGEILSNAEQANRREKNQAQYFINLLNGKVMDSRLTECFAKYANDADGSINAPFKNNAFITLNESDKPCLVASRSLKAGEEIFCSYGENYWSEL